MNPVRRPADGALDEECQHGAFIDHGLRGGDVYADVCATAPDRQQTTDVVQQALLPGSVESRRCAAQKPWPRLARQGAEYEQRVDPAAMQSRGEDVAAGRQVGATVDGEADPADAKQKELTGADQQPVEQARSPARSPAEPVEALERRPAATYGQRLRPPRAGDGVISAAEDSIQ
ncbi:MAG: hypothetical protein M3253_04750 [Chloroflexota bacterium]|nr:hypothetical protein [Chloroflexota bacterium]